MITDGLTRDSVASRSDREQAGRGFCWVVIDRKGRRHAYADRIHDAAAEANRIRGTAWTIDGERLRRIGGRQ